MDNGPATRNSVRQDSAATARSESPESDRATAIACFECHRRAGYLLLLPRVLSEHSHELAFEVTFELRSSAYAPITTPASLLSWVTAPRRRAARPASSGSAARAIPERAPARYDECGRSRRVPARASLKTRRGPRRAAPGQATRAQAPRAIPFRSTCVRAAELRQHSRVGDTGGLVVVLERGRLRRGRRGRESPRP